MAIKLNFNGATIYKPGVFTVLLHNPCKRTASGYDLINLCEKLQFFSAEMSVPINIAYATRILECDPDEFPKCPHMNSDEHCNLTRFK